MRMGVAESKIRGPFALAMASWLVLAGWPGETCCEEKAFDLFPLSKPWLDVRIPRYDDQDVLTSMMHTESLTRHDEKELRMEGLTLVMFQSSGEIALRMKTKQGLYDVATSTLRTHSTTFIEHAQFEMKGNRLRFDTAKQQGTLEGNVEMLIYGVPVPAQPQGAPAPAQPEQPAGEEKAPQEEPVAEKRLEVVQASPAPQLLTQPRTDP